MNVTKFILILSLTIYECYFEEINENIAAQRKLSLQKLRSGNVLKYMRGSRVRGVAVAAYAGAAATLPCARPVRLRGDKPTWLYSESVNNLTLKPMGERETGVEEGDLTIYNVGAGDGGAYQCKVGTFLGDLVILEVLDDLDGYVVVKPNSEWAGPPAERQVTRDLKVLTRWGRWGACSRCGRVGRRRRFGICHLALGPMEDKCLVPAWDETDFRSSELKKLIGAFPEGIPCQSKLLPPLVKVSLAAAGASNGIMIGLCKEACTSEVFEVRAEGGEVVERADNSAGAFSLRQGDPPRPPPPPRRLLLAPRGHDLLIRCPGTTLRDMPVEWRVGARWVSARQLDLSSGGRVHLNARDHLLLGSVRPSDDHVYSCWQRDKLAGVVKVKVYQDTQRTYGRRLAMGAALAGLGAAVALAESVCACQRRRRPRPAPRP